MKGAKQKTFAASVAKVDPFQHLSGFQEQDMHPDKSFRYLERWRTSPTLQ
jgi:hypothetical protein